MVIATLPLLVVQLSSVWFDCHYPKSPSCTCKYLSNGVCCCYCYWLTAYPLLVFMTTHKHIFGGINNPPISTVIPLCLLQFPPPIVCVCLCYDYGCCYCLIVSLPANHSFLSFLVLVIKFLSSIDENEIGEKEKDRTTTMTNIFRCFSVLRWSLVSRISCLRVFFFHFITLSSFSHFILFIVFDSWR